MSVMPPASWIAILQRVATFARARGTACYVVGGLLREQLCGRQPVRPNVDLALASGALAWTQQLAAALHGTYVPLDETAGSARVVVAVPEGPLELDVSEFRGPTLEADLRLRDFTVNAMAVALDDWLASPADPHPLIDPLDGRGAVAAGRLIACFPGTFAADPVRVLRAYRFAVQADLAFDDALPALIRRETAGLARVAGERIREEVFAILRTDRAHEALRGLDDSRALDVLFPELVPGRGLDQGTFHHLDVLGHEIEAVAQADRFLSDFAEFSPKFRGPLAAYCAEEPVAGRPRKALIKLAALLHDVGKPSSRQVHPDGDIWFLGHEQTGAPLAEAAAVRLRLATRETDTICQLVRQHLRPGFLSREPQLTRRAVYRFYKELGDNGPACLLEWWADRLATRGAKSRVDQIDAHRAFLEQLLGEYFFTPEEAVRPPRIVDGRRLMAALRIPPGPALGTLLAAIEEAQAEGRVATTDEAIAFARTLLAAPRREA